MCTRLKLRRSLGKEVILYKLYKLKHVYPAYELTSLALVVQLIDFRSSVQEVEGSNNIEAKGV